jgi:meiotic recombination protein SPO11
MVWKYGSRSMAFDCHRLAVPNMRVIGLLPSDLIKFEIPESARTRMSSADNKKADSLLKDRDCLAECPEWTNEIALFITNGWKASLISLTRVGVANYIRSKLVAGLFI